MSEKKIKSKIDEYSEGHSFWTGQAIKQFEISINLFFATGVGFLAYLVTQREKYGLLRIDLESDIYWSFILYLFISLVVLVSVILGAVSVMSRLHDLRLTRHTLWIRKKSAKDLEKIFDDDHIDISEVKLLKKIGNFCTTLFRKNYFIDDNDLKDEDNIEDKFQALRKRNLLLGNFSWFCHTWQVMTLSFAVIIYSIVWIIK